VFASVSRPTQRLLQCLQPIRGTDINPPPRPLLTADPSVSNRLLEQRAEWKTARATTGKQGWIEYTETTVGQATIGTRPDATGHEGKITFRVVHRVGHQHQMPPPVSSAPVGSGE